MDYKKLLQKITVGFILLLIFLTFFSRTLLDLNIPRVSVAFVQRGNVHPEAMSTGIVTPADYERVFSPASGRITQILERGDDTNHASVLFTISSDLQMLHNSLAQEEHMLRVNSLSIEQTTSNRAEAVRRLNQLQNQPLDLPLAPVLNLWEFEIQLESNTNAIEAVEEDIATLEILYSEGVIPRQDITRREADLARLLQNREEIYTRQDQATANYETAVSNHQISVAALQRGRTEQVQAQQNVITGLDFTLTSQNLERERIEARIADITEQIEMGGVVYVQLDENPARTVTEITPGLDVGSMVMEGMPVMTTSLRNNRFVIRASYDTVNSCERRVFMSIRVSVRVSPVCPMSVISCAV
jgi:hypothetical protein